MDLEVARKALSKRSNFSPKRVAFFVVAGICLVGGILLRSGQYFAQPEVELKTPVAVAPLLKNRSNLSSQAKQEVSKQNLQPKVMPAQIINQFT